MESLKRILTQFALYCLVLVWKLKARFGYLNVVKDGIIYPKKEVRETPKTDFQGNMGQALLKRMKANVEVNGDFACFINGPYTLKGTTQTCGDKSITMSRVIETAEAFGSALYNAGCGPGDVVHFAIPNCTEYHALTVGVWMCNGVCSLGDPGLAMPMLKTQLEETNAKFVVCYQGSKLTLEQALKEINKDNIKVIVLDQDDPKDPFESFKDFIGQDLKKPEVEKFDEEDTAVIFWSSGTTGQPKGIQHSFKTLQYIIGNLENYVLGVFDKPTRRSGDITTGVATTCFFHVGGFLSPFANIFERHCLVFNHGPDLDNENTCQVLFEEIDAFKPLYMNCGSHHLVALSKEVLKPTEKPMDLSSPLLILPTGSTIPKTLFEDLKQNLPNIKAVFHGFAMTEIPAIIAYTMDSQFSLGGLGPSVQVKIVDPETGKVCGQDEIGEFLVKSKVTMKGYLNCAEENSEFFGNQDGFVHTGDLVSFNHLGNLIYEGRMKDLIKYKNQHIYPLEIESVIRKHPEVMDVGVFGRPEPTVQELVTALVVKQANSTLTENEVISMVQEALDDSRHLRGGVAFVDKLPKNPVGKTLRKKLPQLFNDLKNNQ